MYDSPSQRHDHAASESPYDLRSGASVLAANLRRVSGAWRMPSTWRATGNLVLWFVSSCSRGLVAVAGLLASVATGWRTGVAVGVRASVVRALAEMVSLDSRRIARFSGARIPPLALAGADPGASPSARQQSWAESPLRWRLTADALVRAAVASAALAAAVVWWWVTILAIEMAVRRLELGLRTVHSDIYYKYNAEAHILGVTLRYGHLSQFGAVVFAVLGVVGLMLWPAVPRAASVLDLSLARSLADWLLGPSTQELTREVGRLSETRAQAVTAADAERRRIERDLHDGFQPQLVNLALNLGLARSRLATDPDAARSLLERAHEDAKRATEDLRNLVRGIHPSVLDERGLDAAFSALAAESSVRLQIDVHLDRRPPREVEAVAYFVVAETVTNVNKHARAHTATVTVSEIDGSLRVIVHDDGRGGAKAERGGGLAGLADRLAGVDGTFSITSPQGGPTWIEARIPCGR